MKTIFVAAILVGVFTKGFAAMLGYNNNNLKTGAHYISLKHYHHFV
jgi:hypothetical protein